MFKNKGQRLNVNHFKEQKQLSGPETTLCIASEITQTNHVQ